MFVCHLIAGFRYKLKSTDEICFCFITNLGTFFFYLSGLSCTEYHITQRNAPYCFKFLALLSKVKFFFRISGFSPEVSSFIFYLYFAGIFLSLRFFAASVSYLSFRYFSGNISRFVFLFVWDSSLKVRST